MSDRPFRLYTKANLADPWVVDSDHKTEELARARVRALPAGTFVALFDNGTDPIRSIDLTGEIHGKA